MGRAIFSEEECPKKCLSPFSNSPGPNEYNIVDTNVKSRIPTPANASFKSKVAIIYGITQQTKLAAFTPGPCFYNPNTVGKCYANARTKQARHEKVLQLKNKPSTKTSIEKSPNASSYTIKVPCFFDKSKNPNWFFRSKAKNECEEMMKMWYWLHKRIPGPADHNVILPQKKSFNEKDGFFV